MNELLAKQADELRRVAGEIDELAQAERPDAEQVNAAAIRYLRARAKWINACRKGGSVKTGNGYKGALEIVERNLISFAEDLELWTEKGIVPDWAGRTPKG